MSNNASEYEKRRRRFLRWDFVLVLTAVLVAVVFTVALIVTGNVPLDKAARLDTPKDWVEYEYDLPTYLGPGKIEITDIDPGDYVELYITIHNGQEEDTQFALTMRIPDNIPQIASGEHLILPEDCHSWFTISNPNPTLVPNETREIMVSVQFPGVIELDPAIYEVYVSMIRGGQGGWIQVELACRVILTVE